MHKLFRKEDIMTIPNILSIFRILLLPLIVWLYFIHNYIAAITVLIISGLSDIVDGFIARKYNMVSDFGKILDPIADKLTQGTLLICLAMTYNIIIPLIIIFVVKEALMAFLGYITIKKKNSVNSSKWYGKLNTVIIYSVIFLLILFPNIPSIAVNIMVISCIVMMVISLLLYAKFYNKILTSDKKE